MHPFLAIGTFGSMELLVIAILFAIVAFPVAICVYFVLKTQRQRKAAPQPPHLPQTEP